MLQAFELLLSDKFVAYKLPSRCQRSHMTKQNHCGTGSHCLQQQTSIRFRVTLCRRINVRGQTISNSSNNSAKTNNGEDAQLNLFDHADRESE